MSYMYVSCDSHVTHPLPGVARLTVNALPAGIVIVILSGLIEIAFLYATGRRRALI